MSEPAKLEAMRHSLSHILAAAVKDLYSGTTTIRFGIGPAVENGFYYDIDFGDLKISEEDLPKIEKKMRGIIARNLPIVRSEKPRADALKWAEQAGQTYKTELISELPEDETISFYTIGDFTDLCRGPHVASTGEVGPFKLMRVSGAYWKGDEHREQMSRIFGVAFETEGELKKYLNMLEEAKKRDHRKLGRELDLFCFSDLVGAGLPMFTPRGTVLREKLSDYSLSLRGAKGFHKVWTPHITKMDLYKKSGHYDKFGEELFIVNSQVNGETFAMKPMNCPHHAQIFASRPRTYREIPIRYMEATTDYRDEKTGELGGLSRVRSLTQDDSHVFCRNSQIREEVKRLVGIVKDLYNTVGMSNLRARLSYRNEEEKYLGDKKLWAFAQKEIKQAAIDNNLEYFEAEGEAAFYGPKIDFMAEDAIGREHQLATIQLDFVQPERFELEYVNEAGKKERPVMIHHATLGSIERFLSVFIEHTGGWFPFWCAPEQIRILTINENTADYVAKITSLLDNLALNKPVVHNEIRYTLDNRNESLGKKIREAVDMKIPCILIVGPKDVEAGEVSVRLRNDEQKIKLSDLASFIENLK
ncbi:MAG: threonine--tRNA ligase [Candidatus Nomurabacteria bacterium]|jgi:threonyl-tRNA synthetase|nr:threonine--tRNA ligase [Candidatus Nomurabacteria bacterium]